MKISKPKFLLKDPKSDSETLISLVVRWNNDRLYYSTGEKIHPKNWDFKSRRTIVAENVFLMRYCLTCVHFYQFNFQKQYHTRLKN
jgi:hypothetical protein